MSDAQGQLSTVENQINNQRSLMASAQNDAHAASEKAKLYRERMRQVQAVYGRFSGQLDSSATGIHSEQKNTVRDFKEGARGEDSPAPALEAIQADYEKSVYSDQNTSAALDDLERELNRCQRIIDQAEEEESRAKQRAESCANSINALNSQAQQLRQEIKEQNTGTLVC